MKVFIGLGNPGAKYEGTRHNAGFMFLDKFAKIPELSPSQSVYEFKNEDKFKSLILNIDHKGERLLLAKPQTYMNLSGQSARAIMDFYKVEASQFVIISDDIDLPLGYVRIRQEGSSGGQKGLQNIIDCLETDKFTRIRIGVNEIGGDRDQTVRKQDFEAIDFVLSRFTERELPLLDLAMNRTINYILPYIGSKTEIQAHTLEVTYDSL